MNNRLIQQIPLRPLAVAAPFVPTCTRWYLDDFPYRHFVHQGGECPKAQVPRLRMDDRGGISARTS